MFEDVLEGPVISDSIAREDSYDIGLIYMG